MADGEEVTSTLTPAEIKTHLTDNPPVIPEGYADMAADDAQKVGYDASKTSWDTSLVEIQVIIDA
jgi:hypothetical protein|tara:strand:+ start:3032 stop:3226 length:195 start_codon:yes stop_codon:yes gene_type:complete